MLTEVEEENESYKSDCAVAVHLLQCKPSNFVSHKFNTLPSDLQEKVKHHLGPNARNGSSAQHRRSKSSPNGFNDVSSSSARIIRVPISTFPPTAMVYSVNKIAEEGDSENGGQPKNGPDYVSAAIMAKVLEERSKERNLRGGSRVQKCSICRNRKVSVQYNDQTTQTRGGVVTYEDITQFASSNQNGGSFAPRDSTSVDFAMKPRSGSVSSASTASIESLPSASSSNNGGASSQWPQSFAINQNPQPTNGAQRYHQSVGSGCNGNAYNGINYAASTQVGQPACSNSSSRGGPGAPSSSHQVTSGNVHQQHYPANHYYSSQTLKPNETMII